MARRERCVREEGATRLLGKACAARPDLVAFLGNRGQGQPISEIFFTDFEFSMRFQLFLNFFKGVRQMAVNSEAPTNPGNAYIYQPNNNQ